MPLDLKKVAAPLVTLVLLLSGFAVAHQQQPDREHMHRYYEQVRVLVDDIPMQIGAWEGQTVEVPAAAVALLRPNVLLSRKYTNHQTGQSLSFLLIHCRDARDMLGHYPPVCYPGQGWQMDDQEPGRWQKGDESISGMQYAFSLALPGRRAEMQIANLLVLPDGRFAHSMTEVRQIAGNRQLRFYGAAQVQIVFHSDDTDEQRQAIVEQFLEAAGPAIDQIRRGVEEE